MYVKSQIKVAEKQKHCKIIIEIKSRIKASPQAVKRSDRNKNMGTLAEIRAKKFNI